MEQLQPPTDVFYIVYCTITKAEERVYKYYKPFCISLHETSTPTQTHTIRYVTDLTESSVYPVKKETKNVKNIHIYAHLTKPT